MGNIIPANEYTSLPCVEEKAVYDRAFGDRLLSDDGNIKTWHSFDPVEGVNTLRYSQDVEPILDNNIRFQNEHDGYNQARDMQHIAHIPNVVLLKWKIEEGIDAYNPDHWPAVRRKLNDPEYRYLRTGLGRI